MLHALALGLATEHPTPQDDLIGKRHERITSSRIQPRIHWHDLTEQAHQHLAILALLHVQPIYGCLQRINLLLLRLNLRLEPVNHASNRPLAPLHGLGVLLERRVGGDQLGNFYSERIARATLTCLPLGVVVL